MNVQCAQPRGIQQVGANHGAKVEREHKVGPQLRDGLLELRSIHIVRRNDGQPIVRSRDRSARKPLGLVRIILCRDDQRHLDARREQDLQTPDANVVIRKHDRSRSAHYTSPTECGLRSCGSVGG